MTHDEIKRLADMHDEYYALWHKWMETFHPGSPLQYNDPLLYTEEVKGVAALSAAEFIKWRLAND